MENTKQNDAAPEIADAVNGKDLVRTDDPAQICILTMKLSGDEIAARGIELAKLSADRNKALAEAKACAARAADCRKEADVIATKCVQLTNVLIAGEEQREVECCWYANIPVEGKKSLLHPQTKEILETENIEGANEPPPETQTGENRPTAPAEEECDY